MSAILQHIKIFFLGNNKGTFFKRKSKIVIGRALQRLDKCEILGDNVPYAVLQHFSGHGA